MSQAPSKDDRLIRAITSASVGILALIAAIVSYRHMHRLALKHGESELTAALIPLSVDGMIVAASMSILSSNRAARRESRLAWTFLILGSLASVAANVAVAEPTVTGRIVAAWPSFALVGAYEMLTSQMRVSRSQPDDLTERVGVRDDSEDAQVNAQPHASAESKDEEPRGRCLQEQAWAWALERRTVDGDLPSGHDIGRMFGRSPRWGRLVKRAGNEGLI